MSQIYAMVESQSLNAVVAGFSFASAIAWMDVVRWTISNVVKVNKTTGAHVLLTALLTTVFAVIVFLVLRSLSPRVKEPVQPMYAVR